jgi:hypothetical protein
MAAVGSILSFPNRGPWGDHGYRGNCSGYVYREIFERVHPRVFTDPMVGSGTSVEVAREIGIEAYGLDLHSGFNILKQRIVEVVGKPSDLVLSHPPYHNMVVYSGNVWGRGPHADDLSRCASEEEFLDKLTIALKNQRHATRAGGLLRRDHRGCSEERGVFKLSSRSDCAHAEEGIAGCADQAAAQCCEQRQELSAKAAAHHARICDPVAAATQNGGVAREEFRGCLSSLEKDGTVVGRR